MGHACSWPRPSIVLEAQTLLTTCRSIWNTRQKQLRAQQAPPPSTKSQQQQQQQLSTSTRHHSALDRHLPMDSFLSQKKKTRMPCSTWPHSLAVDSTTQQHNQPRHLKLAGSAKARAQATHPRLSQLPHHPCLRTTHQATSRYRSVTALGDEFEPGIERVAGGHKQQM